MTVAPTEPPPVADVASTVPRQLVVASDWVWRSALVAAAVVAAGWLFLYLRLVTVPAFIAVLATTVLYPLAAALQRRGWPRLLATWATLVTAAAVVAGAAALLVPMVSSQAEELDGQISDGIADVENWLVTGPLGLDDDIDLRELWSRGVDRVLASDQLIDGVTLAGEVLAGALLAIVMTFFFLKDGAAIVERLRSLVPLRRRAAVDRAAVAAWSALGAYVRGTGVVGLVNGTVVGIGLAVIGVPFAVPLAVITALSAFFPLVGAVVAGAIAALVALFASGVTAALLVLGLVVVVQQVEGDVLSPVVMGRALRLHPLVILVALTVGAIVAGILGAFLAIPFAGVLSAALGANRAAPPGAGSPDDVARLDVSGD